MKANNVVFGVLMFLIVLLGLNFIPSKGEKSNSSLPPPVQPNEFLIGAANMGWDHDFYLRTELHFNTWHNYLSIDTITPPGQKNRWIPSGWGFIDQSCSEDKLFNNNYSQYTPQVIALIQRNKNYGYWSMISRAKIEYLIRGQKSIYKCKEIAISDPVREWWYAFNVHDPNISSEYVEGNGDTVRKCTYYEDCPTGYVVQDVRAKYEQCAIIGQNGIYCDSNYFWYIKPKIKIPQYLDDGLEVCKIEVYTWDNIQVLDRMITAGDFKYGGVYNGDYIEEFFNNGAPNPIKINGKDLTPQYPANPNQFDIRVKWLGNCDMYIDYVKMESDISDELFKDIYIQPNLNWIKWESDYIGNANGAYRFWVDEPDFNMLPCVKYVQDKIPGYNPNTSLLVHEYSFAYTPGGKQNYNMYSWKLDAVNQNEVNTTSYPLGNHCVVPYYYQNEPYNVYTGLLGEPASERNYESAMQDEYDNDLISWTSYGLQYAKEKNKILYFNPQVHLYSEFGPSLREPTNEEIEAMVDIMVSYGAKGILYFDHMSWGSYLSTFYCRGIIDTNGLPRTENVYHQNKYGAICALDQKLQTWGPTLMSLPIANTNSYSYRIDSSRWRLLSNSYFNGIITFKPGSGIPNCVEDNIPSGMTYDCPDATYLQVATMRNSEPYTQYFMIVNRRCYPDTTNNNVGGARFIRVRFDANSPSFPDFNSWEVVNVENSSSVGEFNKEMYSYLNLSIEDDSHNGWFKPGEGRLYKICTFPTLIDTSNNVFL